MVTGDCRPAQLTRFAKQGAFGVKISFFDKHFVFWLTFPPSGWSIGKVDYVSGAACVILTWTMSFCVRFLCFALGLCAA